MPVITGLYSAPIDHLEVVPVVVDRHTLEKRRWRVPAQDGFDLAVDLMAPCSHGDVIWATGEVAYVVRQTAEKVLEIPLPEEPSKAASLGWFLGNQHLPVQVLSESIRLAAHPHLVERLEREGIEFEAGRAVFSPAAHSHGHSHVHVHPDPIFRPLPAS